MKEYSTNQIANLNVYINMVLGELTGEMRTKIKTLITIEVHARDVVLKYINERVETAGDFAWQSQLKFRWDEEKHDCFINISDAEFRYSYEYVGNPGRLVITGLTDRCYITLTQALRLCLGGAPAGPAGTGKTETTKDLGRGLAIWVIVMVSRASKPSAHSHLRAPNLARTALSHMPCTRVSPAELLRSNELQDDGQHLHGTCADGRVGLL